MKFLILFPAFLVFLGTACAANNPSLHTAMQENRMASGASPTVLSKNEAPNDETPNATQSPPDGTTSWMLTQLQKIREMGVAGAAVFVLLYIAATVAFVPGSVLTIGSGVLFGPVWGTVLVSIASVTGASIAFLLGRYIVRKPIEKKVRGNERFEAIDDAVGREGWKIVLLTRLSPVFPFNLQNYAYGLTKVRFAQYVLSSWIGMLPGTILYVYLGSAAGNLAEAAAGGREKTTAEVIFFWAGLALTAFVTIYVTRIAKKALNKQVEVDEAAPDRAEAGTA